MGTSGACQDRSQKLARLRDLHRLTTAIGLERQLSDEDRTFLRRHHVAVSPIEYEGRVYFPRVLGQMADGSSSVAAHQVISSSLV